MLSYGAAAFARSVSTDLLTDLLGVYPAKDACAVMAIATLRIIHPSITADRMGTHYRRTFVCRHYPGVALSANTVCIFLQKLVPPLSLPATISLLTEHSNRTATQCMTCQHSPISTEERVPGSLCVLCL